MSADLFAEFGAFGQPSTTQGAQPPDKQKHETSASANDPFAFSSFGAPSTVPQPAFGNSSSSPQWSAPPAPTRQNTSWGDFAAFAETQSSSQSAQAAPEPADDEDGWGDFESAEPVPKPAFVAATPPVPASAVPQRTRIVRASTIDLISNNLVDVGLSSEPSPAPAWSQAPPAPRPAPRAAPRPADPNVLFDADNWQSDDEDDDEFGDFETVEKPPAFTPPAPQLQSYAAAPTVVPAAAPTAQLPSLDLLSLDDFSTPSPAPVTRADKPKPLSFGAIVPNHPPAPASLTFERPKPSSKLATSPIAARPKPTKELTPPTPLTGWPESEDDKSEKRKSAIEEWAAFDDLPPNNPRAPSPPPPASWNWDAEETPEPPTVSSDDKEPPPINVPPPSILLSAFPALLDLANSSIFSPLAGKSASIRQKVLSDPSTVDFLKSYLLLSTVAARVVAGRKLRWNRDKFLIKGMSISAAGSKGMKLAGVDKAQTARDDREAADVLMVWNEQVGRLRSAVAAANSATGATRLKVPDLAENMPVQTAKMVPTAPRPCVICGLKRDERVTGVDHDVEDSFGEWWVEHWGHRACKNFWLQHEKQLRQR